MPEPVNRTARQVETRWDMPSDTDGDSTFDPSRFAPLALDDEPDDGEMVADTTADEMLALPAETAFFEEGTAEDHYEEVPGYGDNNLLTYPDEELDAMQPRRSRKGVLAVAALVGVLVVGGVAVMLMRSSGSIGPPPIIVADASPTKITPENAAGGAGDSQSKLIYDRVDPDSEVADSQLVVSNDPEVAEIPPVPEEITSGDVSRVILGGGPGVDEQGDAPDVADGGTTPETGATSVAASSTGPAPIGPKKVRTVVVRPDGTIVSSEAVALEEEPTSAPAQADISGTLAEIPPASETPPAPAADENPLLSEDFGAEMTGDAAPEPVPYVASDSSASSSIPDISPGPAPASRPPPSGSTVVATTGSSSGAAISPAPTAGRLGGGFLVQISSQRSEATALETFGELQRRYPSILGDRAPDIQRADLGERGIYYRVRVGYPTREEAVRMCENLKAAGGDCLLATR